MKKLVIKLFVLTAIFTAFFAITAYAAKGNAQDAFAKVNEIRAANGLSPLTWNGQIENAAKVRANEIVSSFSHTRPDGSSWYTADASVLYGENLAQYYDSADEVVAAWMNSPSHKANILKPEFKSGAIAAIEVDGEVYWAEEFGI